MNDPGRAVGGGSDPGEGVAQVASWLDRLADGERSGADGAMVERVARASAIALSAGEDQALARTASGLDQLAVVERSAVDAAMVGRVSERSGEGLVGVDRGVAGRIGLRRWRMAAGIALGGVAVVGAAWLMAPPSGGPGGVVVVPPPVERGDTGSGSDVEFQMESLLSSADSPFGRADLDELAAFEASVGSAVESLRDPWGDGGVDWLGEGGSL